MARLEGLHPYPTGWYAIAFSTELKPGEVKTVHYFGQDIVLFRTLSGEAVAIEPYCPHLGAHLGHGGKVEEEGLRCPFHSWRYAPSGEVNDIPGCDKLPKRARLKRWPICEQDDVICVFHDVEVHEGLRDTPRAPFPFPPLGSEGYTEGRTIEWTLRTHPQEVAENTVDMAHLFPIHSVPGAHVVGKPKLDGTHMNVIIEFIAPGDLIGMPGQDNDVQLDVIVDGLGRIVARTHVKNVGVRARQAIYCTPIDGERMSLRGVVTMLKGEDPAFTASLSELFYESFVHDFQKDFFVWENKRYVERPILSGADGPIGIYRRWTRQFYPSRKKKQPQQKPAAARKPSLLQVLQQRVGGAIAKGRAVVEARAPWRSAVRPSAAETTSTSSGAAASSGAAMTSSDAGAMASSGAPSAGASSSDNGSATQPAATAPSASAAQPPIAPPITVVCIDDYFNTLDERFVPEGSRGVDAVFQWDLSGEDAMQRYAVVRDGTMDLHEGQHHNPTVTIAMDAHDYVRMVNHEIDGTVAFTTGRAKLAGSIPMAMKMRKIFPA